MPYDCRWRLYVLTVAVLSLCQFSGADEIQEILAASLTKANDVPGIPGLAGVTPEQLLDKPQAAAILEWARGAKNMPIPVTTYTQYRRFREAGERPPYEGPYFDKRELLSQAALLVWLGTEDANLAQVNDLIWSICEETTWVVPAHERQPWHIDLFCSETAATLCHTLRLLSDRLPEEVKERIVSEVTRRVLDPFVEHGPEYTWGSGNNNWTGVCAGSVGQAFLLLERDPERYTKALTLVIAQLHRFIANAFEPDGVSLEGMGYWNYGLAEYVVFAEMLRERTGGQIDLLADEKLKAIARFPLAVAMGPHLFASFSDSHGDGAVHAYIGAKLAERTGVVQLLGLLEPRQDFRLHETICDLVWWDGVQTAPTPLESIVLPESGLARLVDVSGGHTLIIAIKAGDNDEPHNQNDVGSFIVAVDGMVFLCDPGAGLYSKDYFSAKRYENIFCNSYGHSVPRIAGMLQATGGQARGILEKTSGKSVRIQFESAYPETGLSRATRDIAVSNGSMVLEDQFLFEKSGAEVEEAFVTWLPVETDGAAARLHSESGILEIRADRGVFAAERLEDASRENHKPEVLSRITLRYPPEAELKTQFQITFHPKTTR